MKNQILNRKRGPDESGFTMVELLVVIIIIGILATIAIPIFLNQQKTAHDASTATDVRTVATNIQALLTSQPEADGSDLEGAETAWFATSSNPTVFGWTITVGDQTVDVAGSRNTKLCVKLQEGIIEIFGSNPNGSVYDGVYGELYYNSQIGGMQGSVTPRTATVALPDDEPSVPQFACAVAG